MNQLTGYFDVLLRHAFIRRRYCIQ